MNTTPVPPSQTSNGASGTSKAHHPLPPPPADLGPSSGAQLGRFNEEFDVQRGSSILDGSTMERANSLMSQGDSIMPSRAGTLKKKASVKRSGSMRRSGSRRSSRAGSVRSLALQPSGDVDGMQSAFFSPVPTTGNPTEILANRFQVWRKVLKDLITYYREIQTNYDHRSKSLLKVSNVINNATAPPGFLTSGGIDDALQMLREYHKNSVTEASKSKDIENDVILALVGLRSDLQQKIKEIKSLSGDFKNSVEKEMENTRKAVNSLQDGLGQSDIDPAQMTGKQDPYLLKLAVDRQVEKQIDEENYLHQAYLNLEVSGRELESIVVGEIQKSYNAYAGILRREADAAYMIADELKAGPVSMPADAEWNAFIENNEHFVDPKIAPRAADRIQYPGRDNELAQEVRAGLLERKSKYLKSYTAGWYVLSLTHLHEFKSADKTQAPIMSLYLPEQKLGSHSTEGGSSHKFMLKGRQTGTIHRGHSWVFRAESYETMLAWFEDLKILTEKSPQERNAFVRAHARSISGTSQRAPSVSSDGIVDDEDDEPFSASAAASQGPQDSLPKRPVPGGRFPSTDLIISPSRGLQAPLSPSSGSSGFGEDHDVAAAAGLTGSGVGQHYGEDATSSPTHAAMVDQYAQQDGINPYTYQPIHNNHIPAEQATAGLAAAGIGGAALGVVGAVAHRNHENEKLEDQAALESAQIAAPDVPAEAAQKSEVQAAREAVLVAAPDTSNSQTSDDSILSDGQISGSTLPNDVDIEAGENPAEVILRPLTQNSRPSLAAGNNHMSVQSISQLHVPGEFPKQTSA